MGIYSPFTSAIFNQTVFGAPPNSGIFADLDTTPCGYDGLIIHWGETPISSSVANEQVLVRSTYGFPTSIWQGTVLLDELSSQGFSTSYVDMGLTSGRFYYYSLFAFSTVLNEWVIAGPGQGLVLTDYDFAQTFIDWLPEWYFEMDSGLATDSQPQGPLARFMGLLGYEMDWIRSEIESLVTLNNVDTVSGTLLPLIGGNLGMSYEPALGMSRSRVLVKNAVHLYKTKGTATGIAAAASAYTGFGAKVTIGKNLVIQLDDSAFDSSEYVPPSFTVLTYPTGTYAHWKHLTNCTVAAVATTSTSGLGFAPQHASYVPTSPSTLAPTGASYLPQHNSNVLQITATSAAIIQLSTSAAAADADVIGTGIPVVQGTTYVLSAYFRPASTVQSWIAKIDWYDVNGTYISSSPGNPLAEATGAWRRPFVVATPPANAQWMGRTFLTSGPVALNEVHYMDATQVEVSTQATPSPTSWEPPRDIKINLLPNRQNLVPDPVGLGGGFGMSATGATLSEVSGPIFV